MGQFYEATNKAEEEKAKKYVEAVLSPQKQREREIGNVISKNMEEEQQRRAFDEMYRKQVRDEVIYR